MLQNQIAQEIQVIEENTTSHNKMPKKKTKKKHKSINEMETELDVKHTNGAKVRHCKRKRTTSQQQMDQDEDNLSINFLKKKSAN